jgi:hypothetical protein
MVHTQIDIVYGVLVTVGDLRKLGYVQPEDELYCIDEFEGPNGLSYVRAWHHSWVDNLEKHHPDRLPPSIRAELEKKPKIELVRDPVQVPLPEIVLLPKIPSQEYAARLKSEEATESDDDGEFPHKRSLVCICVTIGTIELTRWTGVEVPYLAKFNEAAQKFKELVPKELLEVAGLAELQFIPNDCCCCT